VSVPGDKSISHRAAIVAALATGASDISNFSTSHDCAATVSCLKRLGVSIAQTSTSLRIEGAGQSGLQASDKPLDCGNSGSTMRMLAGVLAGQNFPSTLIGDSSLSTRPMKRVIEPLEMMGARIESVNGKPPLRIEGTKPLRPINYAMPVASAQVKSCVLLAALNAHGTTVVTETRGPTRDHTERMLEWFRVPIRRGLTADGTRLLEVQGQARFAGRSLSIPGDVSSAAFLIAAAALLPGSRLEIENVGLNPTRTQFLATLRSLGFDVNPNELDQQANEPLGSIQVSGRPEILNKTRHNLINGELIPQLIDELPLLAVLGTQIAGGIEIRNAAELRLKETDRISTTTANLRAMGAGVEEFTDGLKVTGPVSLHGGDLNSFGDHRIAMAFTIAALLADGDSELSEAECVDISFPEFFDTLESVVER
jgi:3-phosphoshikimate 1-carboxyvinyltransferase